MEQKTTHSQKIIQNFLRYLISKGVSTSSLKYYKSDIANFLSWAADRKIDNKLVREYINSQRLTTPLSTLNRRLSTLRSYSNFVGQNFMSGIENVTNYQKVTKSWQDAILAKFEARPKIKNLFSKILFNRPNWYKKYHSFALANYIHIAILILFSSLSGYAVYDQVFYSTDRSLAFPTALERPNRFLSFQGRLTDNLGNPETVATNVVFKLYSVSSGGVALWDSGTCSITPDQDGIFSTLLGSSCGAEIASGVFSENADIWLGVTVGADAEATPRIQIATVAYALNSETLQGFPAGTGTSTIPYIDSTGTVVLASSSPKIQSTSGTFAVEGQALTITTPNTSNGIITINPDGTGTLDLTFEGAAPGGGANGFVNATNANITSGSLYSGTVANGATGYNFINFLSGASPASVFSVQNDGDIVTSGDITVGGGNINTGNIALTVGDVLTDSITLTTDGTGNGEVVLPNDSIGPNEILSTGQTDEYCLTYETTGTTFEWQTCGAGGGMNSFTVAGDSGGGQAISDANTLSILGGTNGIDTVDSVTDTVTLNLDTTEIGNTTFGSGSGTTWTFDSSAGTDTTIAFGDNTQTFTTGTAAFTGDLTLVSAADLIFGGTTALSETTSAIDSGGYLVGAFDEFDYSNSTTVQGVLNDLDSQLLGLTTGTTGLWTDSGTVTYLTSATDDFAIGGTTLAASMFGIDESAGNFYFGYDNSANPTLNFEATDADAGEFGFNTNDSFFFSNANVGVGTTGPDAKLDSLATSGEQLRLTYTDGSVYSGFTVDSSGYLTIDPTGSRIALDGSLQVGSTSTAAYSRFGTAATSHAGNVTASNDLLVSSDLELDGNLYLDGGTIANAAGTASVILSSSVTDTANTLSASNWLVENTANVGQAALMINQTKSGDLLTASASGITKFTVQNDGDVVLSNQLQLGNLASNPTALGAGAMYFNTTTNTNQCYNGTSWFNCGGTLYSNTNASVADGSYITVTHNLATNDLLSSAWISAQGLWKELDSSYKPAIAWEGKDTQKGVYHNSVNEYISTNETSLTSTALNTGLLYDTFEDSIKTDSANTTVSVSNKMGDNDSANYVTLDQRVQEGRVGLIGGQTMNNANTDNDGQEYLIQNAVKDIQYYDRSKDSTPEVLVELGIDPNWYNGVTLSVATSSATYAQSGTIADKNPNLTTSYNGSLIKASGVEASQAFTNDPAAGSSVVLNMTDTTGFEVGDRVYITSSIGQEIAKITAISANTSVTVDTLTLNHTTTYPMVNVVSSTIYITIKSPTTFDWTNYDGESATGVTITPGTAQTLGSTDVSVTFTSAYYNVGDVFKIASWYFEPESRVRGARQQFPERSYIISSGSSSIVSIVDADTQKVWIYFIAVAGQDWSPATSVKMLNGILYYGQSTGTATQGFLHKADFVNDRMTRYDTSGIYFFDNRIISNRYSAASSGGYISTAITLVNQNINDIDAAVIPNQPTQEVTVSGWGYIAITGGADNSEYVNFPYKFNNIPKVSIVYAGYDPSGNPESLADCTNRGTLAYTYSAPNITTKDFRAYFDTDGDGTFGASACYSWTATGTVSPKQFVTVATGATSTDGGTTIINETDWAKADVLVGSQNGNVIWQNKSVIKDNNLYVASNDSTGNITYVGVYYGIHGLPSDTTWAQYRSGYYRVGVQSDGWSTNGPTIAGSATGTSQILSLDVTSNTSTTLPNSNSIYVGTASGVSVINEKRGFGNYGDSSVEFGGSTKYYSKDYISEEMIGDIRGMWPLNGNNTSSDLEDISVKANVLTATNITAADAVSGVRGEAYDFDGSTEQLSCTDANCGGTTKTDIGTGNWSVGSWIKTSSSATQAIISKGGVTTQYEYSLQTISGAPTFRLYNTVDGSYITVSAINSIADGNWHHVVGTYDGTTISIYVDGQLNGTSTTKSGTQVTDSTSGFWIGARNSLLYFTGSIDEPFVTATTLTASQIKNMYQVGYRALQSHGTTLGGGSADANQQLGYISTGTSSVGAVAVDDSNQYMYVGTNSTTLGALSKIQLNSDTNIKTYTSSANVPTGGTVLRDEDVNSLAVGETLYAVGSAASGIKSMGVDNNSTATSGNFVSKTYTLPKNIGSAVLWVSGVTDASDGSNTLTVKASNDSGSNYVTCTLVNTNSNPAVAEKEYACTFSTADNDLKVKFEFVRGSTKTNTYVVQYGISWLGETGFRVEQTDTNNVRLYNFSGETQNLKLNVTGASTSQLANPWTDGGSYLYPTGYEALRIYDGAGTNYLGLSHDGTLANLTYNSSTILSINSTGDLLPNTDDTQTLGSDTKRWKDIFLGPATAHIGTSTTDEGTISYNTTSNILEFSSDATSNADIAFFTDDLYLDKSSGNIGIGITSPAYQLHTYKSGGNYALIDAEDTDVVGLLFGDNSSNVVGRIQYVHSSDVMQFFTSGTEKLRIGSNGDVGIGTSTPGQKLVVGDITAQNTLRVNGLSTSNMAPAVSLFRSGSAEWVVAGGGTAATDLLFGLNPASYTDANLATSAKMVIQGSSGNVGIGTSNPAVQFDIRTAAAPVPVRIYNNNVDSTEYWSVGPAASDNFVVFNESNTGMYIAHGATAWTANSDERLKTNISEISELDGLEALMKLSPIDYNWKDINTSQAKQTGFIAQEVQDIFPNLVSLGETTTITLDDGSTQTIETPLGVNYTGFIPYIIKAIQQQQAQINDLFQSGLASIQNFVAPSINTNIISPIADSDLIIDLDPNDNNSPSKLAVKGVNNEEVASIDATGNAQFDATVTSSDLAVNNDATISGTLYADNIESKRIEDIEELLQEVETNQSLLAQASSWNTNTATESASLDGVFETLTTNQLYVTDQIAATSLFVSDNFTTTNINSLDSTLQIQSLAASPLEIMAGKIIIDTNGDTKFMGNVEIAGNLTINNIIVANNIDPVATESGILVEGEINSNSTAGKALLAANTDVIRINNNKVSQNTLIYITPITSTQNKVLFVKSKGEGYFEVGFSDTLDTDVEFNWWIIELANFETTDTEENDAI
ncbi:MAG: LamG-like jellyroll fold domain-containing protein [Microgenomates group bacterium]